MKKRLLFLITLLFVFISPLYVKADTWLDDPSYRDTSWFDPSTYESTSVYTFDTAAKVAGLIYLVNEENYSFENKLIVYESNTQFKPCENCNTYEVLDMRDHEWVPLGEGYKGVLYFGSSSNYSYTRILTQSFNKKIGYKVTESGSGYIGQISDYTKSNMGYSGNFQLLIMAYFDVNMTTSGNGTVTLNNPYVDGYDTSIIAEPDPGYYLESIRIKKQSDNSEIILSRIGEYEYYFGSPGSILDIEVSFAKQEESTCKYIKGKGNNLGDEVACGSEHFYVLGKDNNNIKLFSKYNLNAGVAIYKVPAEAGKTCAEIAAENDGVNKSDAFYTAEGYCFYYKYLPTIDIKQSEDAKSAHWDSDLNYLYPQVGDVYMYNYNSAYSDYEPINKRKIGDTDFYDYDLDIDNVPSLGKNTSKQGVRRILYQYRERLNRSNNINVQKIELLSLTDLNNILNQISGSTMPLKEWGDQVKTQYSGTQYNLDVVFGNIKPYVPQDYKWLYSTTYWNSSVFSSNTTWANEYFVFIAEQGKLCGAGFAYCAPTTTLGCGVRPVVTLSTDDIKYSINVVEDTRGTIETIDAADGNEEITFNVIPNFGYMLENIIIETPSGERIEFTEDEIIENSDGTVSISKNKFTMPYDNVTIKASWKMDPSFLNPKTGNIFSTIVLLIAFVSVIFINVNYNKKRDLI